MDGQAASGASVDKSARMDIFAPMHDLMLPRRSPFRCQRAYEGMLRTLLELDPFRFTTLCVVAELGPYSPLCKSPAPAAAAGEHEAPPRS